TRESWGGQIYALDGAHPKVQQWLFDLARRVVRDWGYDYLRIDALRWATLGTGHYGGLTHAEAYRGGLGAIRDGLGTEAFVVGSAAPLQHAVGLVNGMRIAPDVAATWGGLQPAARRAGRRLSPATAWSRSRGPGASEPETTPRTAPVTSTKRRGRRSRCPSAGTRRGIGTTPGLAGTGRDSRSRHSSPRGQCTSSSGRSPMPTRRS